MIIFILFNNQPRSERVYILAGEDSWGVPPWTRLHKAPQPSVETPLVELVEWGEMPPYFMVNSSLLVVQVTNVRVPLLNSWILWSVSWELFVAFLDLESSADEAYRPLTGTGCGRDPDLRHSHLFHDGSTIALNAPLIICIYINPKFLICLQTSSILHLVHLILSWTRNQRIWQSSSCIIGLRNWPAFIGQVFQNSRLKTSDSCITVQSVIQLPASTHQSTGASFTLP